MRQLSGLLGGISHRSVDAESVLDQLGNVLQKAHDLLVADRERS